MKLGEIIVKYRQDHGLSQRQFATICGLSNGYVSMIENDINPSTGKPITPTIENLQKIARAIGVSLEELMNTADDMPVDINSGDMKLSEFEKEIIRKMRQLDDRGRLAVINTINFELKNSGK